MSHKHVLDALKPLFLITKVTGTQHIMFNETTGRPCNLTCVQKLYNVCVAILLTTLSIYSLIGKFMYAYEYQLPVIVILNILFQLSLTLGVISQSVLPLFTKSSLCPVIEHIIEANEKIQLHCQKHTRFFRLIAFGVLVIFHLFVMIFVILDMVVWITSFGVNIARYYVSDAIMLYELTLHSSQLFFCLELLRERFKCLNQLLPFAAKNQFYRMQSAMVIKCSGVTPDHLLDDKNVMKPPSVRELSRIHDKLYDACIEMNKFFGTMIVIMCFEVFLMMTESIYSGVVFGTGLQKTFNTNFHPLVGVAVMICWTFYSLVLVVFLTSLCEFTSNAANETGIIAQKILLEDGISEKTVVDLTRMASQIQQQNLKFSACGLFGINLTTLLQLLGAVSSYLIVAFQFEGMMPSKLFPSSTDHNTTTTTLDGLKNLT